MATKTKKRPKARKATKKVVRRRITPRGPAKASTNGKGPARTKTAPSDKFADNQPTLPTMEDTNERIPELDEVKVFTLGFERIHGMKYADNGDVVVTLGRVLGPVQGDGWFLTFKKGPDGSWSMSDSCRWIS